MKRIILTILFCYISVSIYATDYFVSSTRGNDSNDGLTEQTAWKSISKVNSMMGSLKPGDVIAFKSNDKFTGRLDIHDKNGDEAEPITFTSYESGAKPIIDVTREYKGAWTNQGGNFWKSMDGAYPSTNKRIMIDGVEVLTTKIQNELGTNIPDLVEAYSEDATKTIYIYSTTDPSKKTVIHSGDSRAIYITNSSYINIKGIELRGGYYHGLTISKCKNVTVENTKFGIMNNVGVSVSGNSTTHCYNIVVKNCYIDSFYRFDYRETPNRNNKKAEYRGMSDAIRFYDCIGGEVSNNTIIDAGHTSISLTAENDSFAEISGIKVFNNHCQLTDKRDYGGGITLDRNVFGVEVYNNLVNATKSSQMNGHNNHIHHNIFKNIKQPLMYDYPEGFGIDLATYAGEVHSNIVENNVFDNCASGGIRFRATKTKLYDNKVRNNIINNCGAKNNNKGIEIKYGSAIFNNNFFNNIIFNKNTTDVFFDGATDKYYTVSEFNTYTDYGINADNQSANPMFLSASNYHLKENSPAVNKGVTPLSTKDFEGNSVPYNDTLPDIGAYEFIDNSTGSINAGAGSDQTICQGETVTLTASGGSTYSWNTGATTKSITVSPNATTTYTVTVTEGTDSDSDSVQVTVNTVKANAGSNTTINQGEQVTLTASGGGTYSWNTGATTQSITLSPNTTTTYSVSVTNNGCEDTDEVIVTVNQNNNTVIADAGSDQTICQGETVTLTASGGSTYSWNTGATTKSITVSPNTTTTYTVTVSEGSASDSDSVQVTVNSVTANAGSDKTIYEGESVTLTASGGDSYQWSTGATTKSITVSPQETLNYTLTAYENGCEDTDTVQVTVNKKDTSPPPAKANAGEDQTICLGDNIKLTASGGTTYLWSTGETSKSIYVNPTRTTSYSVTATRGGVTNSDVVVITVENCSVISENTKKEEMTVYPNPSTGTINIKADNDYNSLNLNIYSMNGSIVYSDIVQTNNNVAYKSVDLSNLNKGVYIVRMYNSQYNKIKKIFLQ